MWPSVEAYFVAALEHAQGEYTLEQLQLMLTSGQWLLLVAVDAENAIHGAGAVHLFNRGAERVAYVKAVGGRLIVSDDSVAQVRALMKSLGATYMECAARPSAARLWQQYGLTPKYQVLGAAI